MIPEDVSSQIINKKKEIKASEKNKEIKEKEVPQELAFPEFSPEIELLLETSFESISQSAELEIENHVSKHKNKINEQWISSGVKAIHEDECPFCGQNLEGIPLIKSYKFIFSDKYKELQKKIEKMKLSIEHLSIEKFNDTKNENLMAYWRQYLDIDDITIDTKLIGNKFREIKDELTGLVKKKIENPMGKIKISDSCKNKISEYKKLTTIVDRYNKSIMLLEYKIKNVKKSSEERSVLVLKKELEWLNALEKRTESNITSNINLYTELLRSKSLLEEEKRGMRNKLDSYTESIFPRYQQVINKYLENFDAGFSILKTQGRFIGGKPSSNYQFVIKNIAFDIGDSKSPKNVASFKNTLSSGDKSTLALSFFLASLELEEKPEERIVVFDDPFTSQDRFRRNYTKKLILNECNRSKQVIVLSHNEDFIKMIWSKSNKSIRKSLQIIRTSGSSAIVDWDVESELQSISNRDHEILVGFKRTGDGSKVDVVRAIRPWIESWLRKSYTGCFADTDSLGKMIEKIRNAQEKEKVYDLTESLEELDEINGFATQYQHGEDSNSIKQSLDVGELTTYVKRALKFTGPI